MDGLCLFRAHLGPILQTYLEYLPVIHSRYFDEIQVSVDEKFSVLRGFYQAKMTVKEVCEEESEVVDELLILVIGSLISCGDICGASVRHQQTSDEGTELLTCARRDHAIDAGHDDLEQGDEFAVVLRSDVQSPDFPQASQRHIPEFRFLQELQSCQLESFEDRCELTRETK